jgi:hypothetical protein
LRRQQHEFGPRRGPAQLLEHRRRIGALEYYGELKLERGDLAGAKVHLAKLEAICGFGCHEVDELRRWIVEGRSSAS